MFWLCAWNVWRWDTGILFIWIPYLDEMYGRILWCVGRWDGTVSIEINQKKNQVEELLHRLTILLHSPFLLVGIGLEICFQSLPAPLLEYEELFVELLKTFRVFLVRGANQVLSILMIHRMIYLGWATTVWQWKFGEQTLCFSPLPTHCLHNALLS